MCKTVLTVETVETGITLSTNRDMVWKNQHNFTKKSKTNHPEIQQISPKSQKSELVFKNLFLISRHFLFHFLNFILNFVSELIFGLFLQICFKEFLVLMISSSSKVNCFGNVKKSWKSNVNCKCSKSLSDN